MRSVAPNGWDLCMREPHTRDDADKKRHRGQEKDRPPILLVKASRQSLCLAGSRIGGTLYGSIHAPKSLAGFFIRLLIGFPQLIHGGIDDSNRRADLHSGFLEPVQELGNGGD